MEWIVPLGADELRSLPTPLFFVGPAFCGKSELAEQSLSASLKTLVIGTADTSEPELASLVDVHKMRRPPDWLLVEHFEDLVQTMEGHLDSFDQMLVDSINQWIAGLFVRLGPKYGLGEVQNIAMSEASHLAKLLETSKAKSRIALITSEVASGLPPQSASGRYFRQTLGQVNQLLAKASSSVVLVSSGIPTVVKSIAVR